MLNILEGEPDDLVPEKPDIVRVAASPSGLNLFDLPA